MSVPEAAEACGGKEPVLVGRNPRVGERPGETVGRPGARGPVWPAKPGFIPHEREKQESLVARSPEVRLTLTVVT